MDTEEIILKPNHRAKRILYFSKERNIDLENYHFVKYLDHDEITRLGHDGTMAFIREFNPELVIEREFNDAKSLYDDLILWIKANISGVVTAMWMIDSHCLLPRHKALAEIYDFCFVSIYRFYQEIAKINKNTYWLPLCYPQRRDRVKRNKEKVEHDITFVGRWNTVPGGYFKRAEFLSAMKKYYGDKCFFVTDYENMENIYRHSFIALNYSLSNELNFRVFEVLANGPELVTDYVPDIDLIKDLKSKMCVFKELNTAKVNIDRLLEGKVEHDVIRNQIWIQNHHCLIHRHLSIIRTIETGIQEEY